MIKLIIPPIIIVILLACLIVLLSRAMRHAEEHGEEHMQPDIPRPTKRRWFKGYVGRMTTSMMQMKDQAEKLAQKRRITAAVEEARTNRVYEAKEQAVQPVDDSTQRQRMSRMGEIILNYHRDSADGGVRSVHDPAEAHLIQTVERDPQNPDGYERLGDFYMERQNFEDARECYKYVLRLDPRHRRAQEAMKNLDRVLG